MTTTWSIINERLEYFLNDTAATPDYSLSERVDGWNYAQRLLAVQHTPRERKAVLTLGADGRSAALPEDFLSVAGLYDADNSVWWSPMDYPRRDGTYRAEDDELRLYWTFGQMLYLESEIVAADDLRLYYWAYWPDLEVKTVNAVETEIVSDILIPRWAEVPCQHLTAAYVLQGGAMQAADIRTWNMRIDSGTPVQNSRAEQAREHLWWWDNLLARVKPIDYHGV